MRILLLFLATLLIVNGSCPEGFDLVENGQCRGVYIQNINLMRSKAINTATEKCGEIGMQPVMIHNAEEQEYWTAVYAKNQRKIILGIICNANTNNWTWTDGSAVDYKPVQYDHNLDSTCYSDCTFTLDASDGYWGKGCGDLSYNWDIGCVKQLKQLEPVIDSCENFQDDTEDGVCYQVGAAAESWQEAQINCLKLGANLASIHNSQENSFIRRLAVSKGAVNGLFLGGTVSGKGGSFGWIDGTPWDYENFSPGFPHAGFGDCLAMDTQSTSGQWMNMDCAAKLPVACIRDKITVTPATPVCSTDTWKEGQLITSPGFPFSASTPCDFYLTVDSGKRVEAEIIQLEANSCCDHLIIYDGYLGGSVLANLTGVVYNATYTTTSSNIMRVMWQPNGGVNVLGVVVKKRTKIRK